MDAETLIRKLDEAATALSNAGAAQAGGRPREYVEAVKAIRDEIDSVGFEVADDLRGLAMELRLEQMAKAA